MIRIRYSLSGKQKKELDRGSALLIALPVSPGVDLSGDWTAYGGAVDRWVCDVLPEAADCVVRSIADDPTAVWVTRRRNPRTDDRLVDLLGEILPSFPPHLLTVRTGIVVVYLSDRSVGGGNGTTISTAWPNGPVSVEEG